MQHKEGTKASPVQHKAGTKASLVQSSLPPDLIKDNTTPNHPNSTEDISEPCAGYTEDIIVTLPPATSKEVFAPCYSALTQDIAPSGQYQPEGLQQLAKALPIETLVCFGICTLRQGSVMSPSASTLNSMSHHPHSIQPCHMTQKTNVWKSKMLFVLT